MTHPTCTVDECGKTIAAKGLCQSHYARNRRYGSPLEDRTRRKSLCTAQACSNMARVHGLCDKHDTRVRRHGSPDITINAPRDAGLDERLRWTGWTVTATGCWEWDGNRRNGGYGEVATGQGAAVASRAAYLAWVGPIPEGVHICHQCDNPPCINPAHLFPGTRLVNMQDALQKGRLRQGEESPKAKLTAADVTEIKRIYATGAMSQKAVGEMFGISQSNISFIVRGRTWKGDHAVTELRCSPVI
ncbi:HNH endonuclease [Pseudarthrobacter sp. PS3-L1]|uniref:HNH endonuclease n=1 Tax=Pseudarthrobacter sp. PS3-L1 TaxID=3046207 RepID=UPI0024BB8679|nr:HNH endonuclease [Pseudarthrobacter sp. PS3-L1]MDJ0319796.1 HNH endonuclease [Pseudarthrobacter sp. PS3-L1]